MTGGSKFGIRDDAVLTRPTVYQPGLFAGQVVMVSGAGSGIGRAIAMLYARLGAKLVICGRGEAELDTCARELRGLGSPDVLVQALSIGEPAQVERLMNRAWPHFGRVDVLVNIPSAHPAQRALDFTVAGWKAVIESNLNGTWYMMHAMARRWRDSGTPGNIVNLVATFQRGMPGLAHVCAASSAVAYLAKAIAVEWAEYRIRINGVAANVIHNGGFPLPAPEAHGSAAAANPLKRAGNVQDVAEAVIYLSAPSGNFVTGELLTVDGGSVLWGEMWAGPKSDYFIVKP